jgi:hypothetical protein
MSVERRSTSRETDVDQDVENIFGFLGERILADPETTEDTNQMFRVSAGGRLHSLDNEDIRRWVEVGGVQYEVCAVNK